MDLEVTPSAVHRAAAALEQNVVHLTALARTPINHTPNPGFRTDEVLAQALPQLQADLAQFARSLATVARQMHDSAALVTKVDDAAAVAASTIVSPTAQSGQES